jgi:hypothetical protein
MSPKIVCLCGSVRLHSLFQDINLEESLAGNIVLTIADTKGFRATKEQEKHFEKLHKEKIKISNEIIVIRLDKYIGESTQKEIKFATRLEIPIRYIDYKTEYYTKPGEEFDPYGRSERRVVRSK